MTPSPGTRIVSTPIGGVSARGPDLFDETVMTMPNPRRNRRLSASRAAAGAVMLCLAWAVCPGPGAWAQTLPPEVVTASSISPEQARRIQEMVSAQMARLRGSEAGAREAARDALIAPLDVQGITLAFRLEFAKAAAPELERLAGSADDHTSFNALRVAGKLGTPRGVDILRGALGDKRAAVRAGAARSLREAVRAAVTAAQTPINQSKLEDAVESLAAALGAETDPIVAKALVTALDAPRAGAPNGAAGALHARAMERLSASLSARLMSAGGSSAAWADATVAGVDAVRRTFLDPQRSSFAAQATLKKQSATLCGHAIVMVRDVIKDAKPDSPESVPLRSIANAAEITLLLIEGADRPQRLASAVESGDAAAIAAAADDWLKRLERPPFGLDGKQFKRG